MLALLQRSPLPLLLVYVEFRHCFEFIRIISTTFMAQPMSFEANLIKTL